MSLFAREKACVVCGNTAKSKVKCKDGPVCGNCIGRLSPWFTEHKGSSAEDLRKQIALREENKERLAAFVPTKAWGVKKYGPAYQFIYDEERRQFVVAEGPEESFKEREPDVIDFDQVKDVVLEVDEYWSEESGEFAPRGYGTLLQENYDDVFWRYDFYLRLTLDHPYLKEIRYKMNFKPTVLKVHRRGVIFKRGLEIGGTYRGDAIAILAAQMEAAAGKEETLFELNKKLDVILLRNKEASLSDKLMTDFMEDKYLKKLDNIASHIKRADRISRLVLR